MVTGLINSQRGRRALLAGIVVIGVYAALAVWSAHLSPLARGPLLDGLAPTSYRWVDPPPDLASTNQEPSSGEFPLTLGPKGVEGSVVFTSDNQVTVIVATGSIAARKNQEKVVLAVTPLDPATMPPPPDGLTVFGNAYEIGGTYRPSGDAVRNADITDPFDVVLTYPATTTLYATIHELLYSAGGVDWKRIDSSDSPGSQQAEGNVPSVGTVLVAGEVTTASHAPTGATGDGSTATVLLVAAGCVLLLGIALLIRSRRA
jgi:hypothetical protein